MLKLCEKQLDNGGGCVWMVELAWISYNCFLVSISACLVLFVAPVAAASGIISSAHKLADEFWLLSLEKCLLKYLYKSQEFHK